VDLPPGTDRAADWESRVNPCPALMDGWRRDALAYATPQELLGMEERDLVQRFMQALEHVHESGRLRDSDLQLPIYASPQYYKLLLHGYEGGAFDPERLGAAFIVVPPPTGIGPNTPCTFNLSQVSLPPFLTSHLHSSILI